MTRRHEDKEPASRFTLHVSRFRPYYRFAAASHLTSWSRYLSAASFAALLTMLAIYTIYFAAHVWLLLPYPYPLDYGEGPLLAQIELLRSGTPIWRLYSDPAAPPYTVVNYPPLYPLLTAALSWITGSVLLAGRLLSLLAALGCGLALVLLSRDVSLPRASLWGNRSSRLLRAAFGLLPPLVFLSIPIVREWSVLLRVDMLGVCLGLWGLVALRQAIGDDRFGSDQSNIVNHTSNIGWAIVASLLFLLTLYTKPSLIAAPAAGCAWLILRIVQTSGYRLKVAEHHLQVVRHQPTSDQPPPSYAAYITLIVLGILGLGGGLLFALLQWSSGGWFALHAITANANRWDAALARQFWLEEARLRWPLALAALGFWIVAVRLWIEERLKYLALPLLYTFFGIVTALGVGKVGAYTNYFLELYAGLVWLIGLASWRLGSSDWKSSVQTQQQSTAALLSDNRHMLSNWLPAAFCLLLTINLLYYSPMWSEDKLRRAGLLEPSPPRPVYSIWRDIKREAEVLAAQARVQAALVDEVRAAGPVIFTDIPGVATQAGARARLQAFEQRQLFDQGNWDQRQILLELANGELPLAVIDYLGNWLTPPMIELLQRRYAQDGARGTFDLYRPVAPGPRTPADRLFGANLHLTAYHLAESVDTASAGQYDAGELLVVTLEWQRIADQQPALSGAQGPTTNDQRPTIMVVLQLTDESGQVLLANERPLIYGVLPPADWPVETAVQHMQPLSLPADVPPGTYSLKVLLRAEGQAPNQPQEFTRVTIRSPQGRSFAETGHFVPAPILRTWQAIGGIERAGYPLTPAVPFAWGTLQCFEYICLELRNGTAVQRPLGTQQYLAETRRSTTCAGGQEQQSWRDWLRGVWFPPPQPADAHICPAFLEAWQRYGGQPNMGSALSGEIFRNGYIVQWTRYARLERLPGSKAVGLGRLGDDSLRLSPGMRYRWP